MNLFLRKAAMTDAEMILKWRNDPVTRMASFTKNEIDLEAHKKWYSAKLESPDCFLFIMMHDSECVGQLRIDRMNDIGEISYMIAPEKRGMGYGKKIIALADGAVPADLSVLTGLVESSNEASRKCFLRNGYTELTGGNIFCYIKTL